MKKCNEIPFFLWVKKAIRFDQEQFKAFKYLAFEVLTQPVSKKIRLN